MLTDYHDVAVELFGKSYSEITLQYTRGFITFGEWLYLLQRELLLISHDVDGYIKNHDA